jgi:FixJ family two-component response regulator
VEASSEKHCRPDEEYDVHDECLREIYEHLVPKARQVFAALGQDAEGRSIEELMQATRLTTQRVRVALAELRGATLATHDVPACLTLNGRRLRKLLQTAGQ